MNYTAISLWEKMMEETRRNMKEHPKKYAFITFSSDEFPSDPEQIPDPDQRRKFYDWAVEGYIEDEDYCQENKICLQAMCLGEDCLMIYCISAPYEWAQRECPELLGTEFDYTDYESDVYDNWDECCTGWNDEGEFKPYTEENIGYSWDEDEDWEFDDGSSEIW